MTRAAAVLVLLLCACGPTLPTDSAVLRGMAEGLEQSAAATAAGVMIERTRQAQWTLAAYEFRATEIAAEAAVIGTLSAATQAAQYGRATDAAQMVADAQAAGTATAIAGAAQATATERVVAATAAAEDDARRRTAAAAWGDTLIWFVRAMLAVVGGIILVILWHGAEQARRVFKARADRAEAETRRLMIMETSSGLIEMTAVGAHMLIPAVNPGSPSEAGYAQSAPRREDLPVNDLAEFVLKAARCQGMDDNSRVIPRWNKFIDERGRTIGAAVWTTYTDELVRRGLVQKGRMTTLTGGRTLHELYLLLVNSPTPPSGAVIDVQ